MVASPALLTSFDPRGDLLREKQPPEVKRSLSSADLAQLAFRLLDRRQEGDDEATRAAERELRARFPALPDSSVSRYSQRVEAAPIEPADVAQMAKDFGRETVVIAGAPGPRDLDALRIAIAEACARFDAEKGARMAPDEPGPVADAIAARALEAVWRTRVGADAWKRARRHLDALPGEDDADAHALVSRPTEPASTIDVFADRVVAAAHTHLSEVCCDGACGCRLNDERCFVHVALRTTIRPVDAAGPLRRLARSLSAARGPVLDVAVDVLFVAVHERVVAAEPEELAVVALPSPFFAGARRFFSFDSAEDAAAAPAR